MKAYHLSCYLIPFFVSHSSFYNMLVDVFFVICVIAVLETHKDNKKRIGKDEKTVKNL